MVSRIKLRNALGLGASPRFAAVGAGGKTTFLMELAREYKPDVILTTSTHLANEQAAQVDKHFILRSTEEIDAVFRTGIHGITLITGDEVADSRLSGLPMELLDHIFHRADIAGVPLLVEADGSRRLPFKAPAAHEPAIPTWVKEVGVVVGLSVIGEPIDGEHVHRPEIIARLTKQENGAPVTPQIITSILTDPSGGLKNIPPSAKKFALLNQAEGELLEAAGGRIAFELMNVFDAAVVTSLHDSNSPVKGVFAPTGAIILAAGKSNRFEGRHKVLLDWYGEPFVRHIARTALNAQLNPVTIIAGSQIASVRQAVEGMPVKVEENNDWELGQSTSIQTGVRNLPDQVRSVIFLLGDQPQVSTTMLKALVEEHRQTLSPIIAPLVEDRRSNPVLFDRVTFQHLLELVGDTGGRAIFSKYQVDYFPWLDRLMLFDVDTQDDYLRLKTAYGARYDA